MLPVSDVSTSRITFLKAFLVSCAVLAAFLSASLRTAYADGYQISYTVQGAGIIIKDSSGVSYHNEDSPFPGGCGAEIAFAGPPSSDAMRPSASARFQLADASDRASRFRLAADSDRVANLGGTISTTATWQGSVSPPAYVVVERDCLVFWKGDSGMSGSCSNPLGGSATTLTPAGQSWVYSSYTVVNNPGTSIPIPDCGPSAAVVIPAGISGGLGCEYSVSVHPINVNLYGTTPDANNKQNILIGQQCTSAIVGLPSTPTGTTFAYSWSIGESNLTFQDWEPTTSTNPNASYYLDGPGPLNLPTAQWYWYWENSGTETITGTVTVTPPANLGSSFTVTQSSQVNVEVPSWTAFGTGGQMQVNQNIPNGNHTDYWLYAGPTPGSAGHGMDWQATVTSPDTNLFGAGTLALAQLLTRNASYKVDDATYTWSLNGQTGIDTSFPYEGVTGSPNYFSDDSPGHNLTFASDTSATLDWNFNDYLMYQPPTPPGSNPKVCWVPLATFQWDANASVTIPVPGGWAAFGSGSAGPVTPSGSPVKFTQSHSFPSWAQNTGNNSGGHY